MSTPNDRLAEIEARLLGPEHVSWATGAPRTIRVVQESTQ